MQRGIGRFYLLGLLILTVMTTYAEDIMVLDSRERPMMYVNEFGYAFSGELSSSSQVVSGNFVKISQAYFGEPIENLIFSGDINHPTFSASSRPNDPFFRMEKKYPMRPRQRAIIRHWTVKDGLPFNKIRSLHRTRDGFLWIGTENGLARFDGRRMETVIQGGEDKNFGSPRFRFQALYEDESGDLWAGSQGLLRLRSGRSIPFAQSAFLKDARIFQIRGRKPHGHWICTSKGLAYWDGERVQWKDLNGIHDPGDIYTVLQEGDLLMIGCSDGLYHYHLRNDEFISHEFRQGMDVDYVLKKVMLLKIAVRSIQKDNGGTYWLSTNALGVYRKEGHRSLWSPIKFHDPAANPLALPFNGVFASFGTDQTLIGGVHGIHILESGDSYLNAPFLGELAGEVFDILRDDEGSIWVGARQGLFQMIPQKFDSLWHDGTGAGTTLQGGNFVITELPNGAIASQRSSSLSMLQQNRLQSVSHNRMSYSLESKVEGRQSVVDRDGNWWSYFPGGGLFRIARMIESRLEFTDQFKPLFPEIGHVHALITSQSGGLWAGTLTGVHHAFPDIPKISRPFERPLKVACLAEDGDGVLWIGSQDEGLFQWDGARLQSWNQLTGLNEQTIQCLHVEQDSLWIGAHGVVYRLSKGKLSRFDQQAGIPDFRIDGLITDPYGALWMNHDAGISRVLISELEAFASDPINAHPPAVAHYDTEDGMLHAQNVVPPHKACLLASDGRLWFTKGGSLVVTDPKRFIHPAPAPKTFIESISGSDGEIPVTSETVIPSAARNYLDIAFTCTSLLYPDRLRIEYQLEDVDADWRRADTDRRAIYTQLPHGVYAFRLRARNHEGRWSENETRLTLRIEPYLWETTGFRTGMIACVVLSGLGYAGFRVRKVRIDLERKRQESLQSERKRIARDIHDHLGARLAQTALSFGKDEEQSKQLARESLRELKSLVWSIDPDNDTLSDLISFIADTAAQFCAASGHALELDLPDRIPNQTLPHNLRMDILAVVKESFTNIHKHAQASKINLTIAIASDALRLTIADNGIGFDPNGVGHSNANGLVNMRRRIERSEGKVSVYSKLADGTVIQLEMPLTTRK